MTDVVTTTAPRVSVVICAYKEERWGDLVAAVGSVLNQTYLPHEVIVVVDHCPRLLDRARWELADVVVRQNTDQPGLSAARNVGLDTATGDIVAFLDDDAVAAPEWLERLTPAYQDDQVVGVGGLVVPGWVTQRPGWFPPEFDWVVGCSHPGLPSRTGPVRNFIGANMSFRRQALVELGGFSTDLGRNGSNMAGCEETELCIRAGSWHAGAELVYEPEARVLHRVPPARGTWRYFLRRCYGEGQSKALVSRLAGPERALASERAYLRQTIPRGVAHSMRSAAGGVVGGVLRVVALLAGVGATMLGYLAAPPMTPKREGRVVARERALDRSAGRALPVLAGATVLTAVVGLWAISLNSGVRVDRMTDLGLVPVLPTSFWAALGLLTVSFCYWVRQRHANAVLLVAHPVILLLILHATPTLLFGTLRYSWAWKHVGVIDYLIHHGGVNVHLNLMGIYHNWPGFFSLNGLLTSGSGFGSALSYASWGPPVNDLLLLGPLVLILRTLTADRRLRWTAIWLFCLGNWVQQDYFSPQALTYFLYLTVIAVCLRWFRGSPTFARSRADAAGITRQPDASSAEPQQRSTAAMYAFVVVMMLAIASSHQLTPFMLISALALLAFARQLRYRSLPLVMGVLTVGWILGVAGFWLQSNIGWIVQNVGHPLGNSTATLGNLSAPSNDQALVSRVDFLLTGGLGALAILGLWRSRHTARGRRWTPATLLGVAPLAAFLFTNYGTEVIFRVYLFALPFICLYAATLLVPVTGRPSRVLDMARLAVFGLLLAGFVFPYYGKERMNYFPPEEVASMKRLYTTAPPGSLLVGANANLPWAFSHYSAYDYDWFTSDSSSTVQAVVDHPVAKLTDLMSRYRHAYLILSISQDAADEMTGILPSWGMTHIAQGVKASPQFRVVDSNSSITILTLVTEPATVPKPVTSSAIASAPPSPTRQIRAPASPVAPGPAGRAKAVGVPPPSTSQVLAPAPRSPFDESLPLPISRTP